MKIKNILIIIIILSAVAGCQYDDGRVGEYYYRTDMHDQPSYKPQEDPREPVDGTVPVTGYGREIRDGAMANRLVNPVAMNPETAEQGRRLYNIHCSMCHGSGGKGDGTVAPVFQTPPDITEGRFQDVTDGYLYWVIRDGAGIMPAYYEHIRSHERWLIVNHIRSLQQE
jgi:S-disulfanyl-L-cysteine oxidoreductase SoxD